jgi:hypothetical protein
MAKRRHKADDFFTCPNCGADVPSSAHFCRECGASHDSGWNDDAYPTDEDMPGGYGGDDFDYDEFIRREFPDQADPKSRFSGKQILIAIVILLLVVTLVMASLLGW